MDMERKHYVLTYMDSDHERPDTYATYEGEFEEFPFPVKVSFWKDEYLVVPHWFTSRESALEYIEKLASHTLQDYYLVQERHYAKGDSRIAAAKIVLPVQNHFPIQPSRGETRERAGEPVVDVWTMYIMGRDLANQYVDAFNADIQLAREWQQKNKE